MIIKEVYNEKLIKTYSDSGLKIKPIYDRIGNPINENARYETAIDIIVNGEPRYDYEETDEPIEKIETAVTE